MIPVTLVRGIAILLALMSVAILRAQPQQCDAAIEVNDPRNPEVVCLPEVGRIRPTLGCNNPEFQTEKLGRQIIPLGDISGDGLGDWIIGHYRCDTSRFFPYYPTELILYHGVLGGLPEQSSGIRIGPSEINTITDVVALGDFDGDSHIDLACRVEKLGDTFAQTWGYHTSDLIIFWGSASGSFSVKDTSQLSCSAQRWLNIYPSVATDLNNDGVSDLLIWCSDGLTDGKVIPQAPLQLFIGGKGKRWGRSNTRNLADWKWWEVWEPTKINSGWPGPYDQLYNLGDIDFDSVADMCSFNSPWLIFYHGGKFLDSLIDVMIDCRAAGGGLDMIHPEAVAVLGDIDGSHVPTIAVGVNGVLYVKPSHNVPQTSATVRLLPDGTGPAWVPEHIMDADDLVLQVAPNPATGGIRIRWSNLEAPRTTPLTLVINDEYEPPRRGGQSIDNGGDTTGFRPWLQTGAPDGGQGNGLAASSG